MTLIYMELGQCATPGCKAKAGHGLFLTMCQSHADNLARIRAEYEAEGRVMASTKNGGRTSVGRPRCCTPGCDEPRKRGEAFCTVCHALGVEEMEAA